LEKEDSRVLEGGSSSWETAKRKKRRLEVTKAARVSEQAGGVDQPRRERKKKEVTSFR